MTPLGVPETTGGRISRSDPDDYLAPSRIVVLAHADDPRQWQCLPTEMQECSRTLVADRFAWANGASVIPSEPELWDFGSYHELPLRMSLDDVRSAIGSDEVITAAPFQAKDIWTIDPRWNLGGDEAVWLVRSLTPDLESSDATRAVEVSVVDDATGNVIDSHDLALDDAYQPGRLWLNAERRDLDAQGNVPDELESFFSIRSSTGAVVNEPRSSVPVLLPAGDYSMETWLATNVEGVVGLPTRSCTTNVHIDALNDVSLLAVYAPDSECTWTTVALPG